MAPERVPASCEACQPTDLAPGNRLTWEMFRRFPGMIPPSPFTGWRTVDHGAARQVAKEQYIMDPPLFIEGLEAIARGLNGQ